MHRLSRFSCNHAKAILWIIALVTLLFAYSAFHIRIDPDVTDMLPAEEEIAELENFAQEESGLGTLVVAVESEAPFTLEGLKAFSRAIEELEGLPGVLPGLHPFNFLSFERVGSRMNVSYFSETRKAPANAAELERFKTRILSDPFARTVVISEEGTMLAAIFPLAEIADAGETAKIRSILSDLEPYFTVYATGDNLFTQQMTDYIFDDLTTLLLLSGAFLLLFYFLGFRSRRAIFLPLILIVVSIIWCLGFMNLLGFSITMINIILPPLLLTIGSSYTVHILNAFYRESKTELEERGWISEAVSRVSQTIILAGLTTIVGFSSLLITSTEQTRQFGISMSFGIFVCVILSLTFLPAALSCMPAPREFQIRHVTEGVVTRWMGRLSMWVLKRRIYLLVLFFVLVILFIFLLPGLQHQSDYMGYFPNNDPLIQDTNYILTNLGSSQQVHVTLDAPGGEKNYFLKPEVLDQVSRWEEHILSSPDVVSVNSFAAYVRGLNEIMFNDSRIPETKGLILTLSRYFKLMIHADENSSLGFLANDDFSRITCTFRVFNHENSKYLTEEPLRNVTAFMQTSMEETLPDEVSHVIWGNSLKFLRLSDILNRDQTTSTLLSLVIIFLIAALFFRSFIYGAVALVPILCGVMINFIFMVLVGIPLDIITLMVSSVTIGVGVDDAIHFLIQFKRQTARHGHDREKVFHETFIITGRPILLTTITIMGGLIVFVFSNFLAITYFGLLLCLTLLSTLLGTLFILPAFCSLGIKKMV